MERIISTHTLRSDDPLRIAAHGAPNAAGAQNRYLVTVDGSGNYAVLADIRFQDGPPALNGVNGVTIEALIAVCADRLAGFQAGAYPCAENEHALYHLNAALEQLHDRTRAHAARGVVGKVG